MILTGALVLAAGGWSAAPAAQAAAHPRAAAGPVGTTYTGAGEYPYSVPPGTGAVAVTAIGGSGAVGLGGGPQPGGAGGVGAVVKAIVTLPAGTTTLYAEVGGAGPIGNQSKTPAYNGGGVSGAGGGGGGASDVRLDPASVPLSTADTRLVVAGGGGGGGSVCGAAGGSAGDVTVTGAGNAGQSSDGCQPTPGGNGGLDNGTSGSGSPGTSGNCNGGSGSLGQGGTNDYSFNCDPIFDGGAGGGGYHGGGAAGDSFTAGGGGGAGSSYWAPGATDTSMAENTGGVPAEVIISPPAPPGAPSPSTLPDFAAGQANTVTISSSGAPAPALSESGPLPGNVTFTDNGNGTATLAGDPPADDAGQTFDFSVTASNGIAPDQTQDYSLFVGEAPAFNSATSATFTVGAAGTFSVTTSGAVPATTKLSESGALPGGVTFTDNGNGTGTLAGKPAPGSSLGGDGHGNYAIQLTASNGEGSPTVQSFTLTVQPPAPPRAFGTVTVAGSPVVGQTLSQGGNLRWGSPDHLTITRVWERCKTAAISTCLPITGATGKQYRVRRADLHHHVTIRITAADQDGQSTSVTAAPAGPVT